MRLYLASRSPRRRELLNQIGIDFDTVVFRDGMRADSETDETPLPGEKPVAYVERVARAKAIHGLKIVEERKLPMRPVLSADTTLEFNGEIIGKPVDRADAAAILRRLSGQTHRVLTGVAINHMGHTEYVLSSSEVTFREIDDEEIRHYVMSGEPMDKAGAYGIQGRAGLFVKHLAGSFTGVMGLPVCETGELLKRLGFRPL
ncbi:MAG: Maf-like protein [Proteobacteria bacterium]|uniref:dTTP/UTP pyrophosphatase n=1 Tax=Dechloromonas aromatica (strain RCB) TaxID=159087 RepID=NTPPA_DECAR|nr:RecName: Full=dTTP/UTP pyrophosphatase; Short=dTTPase/UTPase; AltName: Full=Nucleoside triphosphate pyrophosphatase; AltName: Full=Nucleotide pyrophosphatase; Short=Nucleotide PPase [Dechloromonas aromatica RCB]MBS1131342.1 Maf-like protein [Pseudomonadota bacterium]